MDAAHYKYRFGVLLKLGVERKEIRRLILKQLGVWFGIPIGTALMISAVFLIYFIGTVAAQIDAYIGSAELIRQIECDGRCTFGVAFLLFWCDMDFVSKEYRINEEKTCKNFLDFDVTSSDMLISSR